MKLSEKIPSIPSKADKMAILREYLYILTVGNAVGIVGKYRRLDFSHSEHSLHLWQNGKTTSNSVHSQAHPKTFLPPLAERQDYFQLYTTIGTSRTILSPLAEWQDYFQLYTAIGTPKTLLPPLVEWQGYFPTLYRHRHIQNNSFAFGEWQDYFQLCTLTGTPKALLSPLAEWQYFFQFYTKNRTF